MSPKITQNFHKIFTSTIFEIDKIRKYQLIAIFSTLGLIFFVLGLISLLASSSNEPSIIFEDNEAGIEKQGNISNREILVDVEGAIVKPGVYRISGDARIKDALIAASGMSSDADREWVAKNINLAQKLTDGGKVYVARKGENISDIKRSTSKKRK